MRSTIRRGPLELVPADVVIVGAGAAGLTAALALDGRAVSVLTLATPGESGATPWAQGGLAAAVGADDSPERHAEDTLAAAGGLADPDRVALLTAAGPASVEALLALGVRFDRGADGTLALGREAAHGRARIVHAGGDATGRELARALAAAVAARANVRVFAGAVVEEVVVAEGRVVGVVAAHLDRDATAGTHRYGQQAGGRRVLHLARAVVLATGGSGRLWARTTNPASALGSGLVLAACAGARLTDLEFLQFHPTALAAGADPLPLVTEALRGAGARLVDGAGRPFMDSLHPLGELAPRDVVARELFRRERRAELSFLDARQAVGDAFPRRFPSVFSACRRAGIDPRLQPIPVSPAAHYHMGGVQVDEDGRSSLPGLWACGEVAATGVHGANRLASNSLLEAVVFGRRTGERLALEVAASGNGWGRWPRQALAASAAVGASCRASMPGDLAALRRLMWERVGVERDGEGLESAFATLARWSEQWDRHSEAGRALTAAWLVTAAARERRESRGAQARRDHPATDPAWRGKLVFGLGPDGRPRRLATEPVSAAEDAARVLAGSAPAGSPVAARPQQAGSERSARDGR